MTTLRALPSLSGLFGEAARCARRRLGTLTALALFPVIPLALAAPLGAQVSLALEYGLAPERIDSLVSPWTAILTFLGLVLAFVVAVASVIGMLATLAGPEDLGPRLAFRVGAQRWVAFLWTQFLTAIVIAAVALPAILFSWWADAALGPALAENVALQAALLLIVLILLLPVFVAVSWYAFAAIPAALGEASGGRALAVSQRLVAGATGQVFGLLFTWFLFEILLSVLLRLLFPGLLLFQFVAYYLAVSLLGSAYLVVIYRALRQR